MKLLIFWTVLGALLVTIVAAVFFRSSRAWDVLHVVRKFGWVYVAVIVLAAVLRLWQNGGI